MPASRTGGRHFARGGIETPVICEMILEETNAYFAGDKTAEETAKVLQSRVGIYVSEHA